MGKADALIKKVSKVLNRVGPPIRLVYLRVYTVVGGDPLIGRPGTVTHVDTLLDPQPYYSRLGRERVPGDHSKSQDVIGVSGITTLADDWQFIVSPDAITRDQLTNETFSLVVKTPPIISNGYGQLTYGQTIYGTSVIVDEEEEFRLIDIDAPAGFGKEIIFICYMRSISRT